MGEPLVPVILKLGGSVITVKEEPLTPDLPTINRLAGEIAKASPRSVIIVHGGGSFGHPIASKYKIKEGYRSPDQLVGFSKTRQAMTVLNKLFLDALLRRNIPAVSIQPSACIVTENGRISYFELSPVEKLLDLGFMPILYGDAVLDTRTGFTILSGDQLISSLAINLDANAIIVGVDVDGLYTDDPKTNPKARLIEKATLQELKDLLGKIGRGKTIDVTGGMFGKIAELVPALEEGVVIKIINAKKSNRLYRALRNEAVVGTELRPW